MTPRQSIILQSISLQRPEARPPDAGTLAKTPGFEHPRHFSDLDGLRGLLALSVVFLHYGINDQLRRATGGQVPGFTFELSVDFFFLLSGYVLTYSMRERTPGVAEFALKRAFRLLPVYFAMFALVLAMAAFATRTLPYLVSPLPVWMVITDLFLVTPLSGIAPLDVPAWSVSFEFYLPILAVALSGMLGNYVRRHSMVLVVALAVGMSAVAYLVAVGGHYFGLRAFLGLSAGCCLYLSIPRLKLPARLFKPLIMYALIASLLVIMFLASIVHLIAVAFPWIAILAVVVGTRTRTFLSGGPMEALGRISYTLYMVHIPVLMASALTVEDVSGHPFIKAVALFAALAAAGAFTIFVERPGMALGNAIARRFAHAAIRSPDQEKRV
ncbi:acyltransferase [Roseiarcaceae bacterium H3SJ34-1]|uniref:acyltransferase family protein n=1 Tax=Terripilifer ovatus TaxID=3032367 RepID=UPI003AB9447D|nr:acyltransferase [Roseiarcaceae bacterium H3SJ34-1]